MVLCGALTRSRNSSRQAGEIAEIPCISTDFQIFFGAQCFVEHTHEAGTVLGKQGKSVDTLYIITSGACEAKMCLNMTCKKHSKASKSETAESSAAAMQTERNVRKTIGVATAGAKWCVGLVDALGCGGVWTATVGARVSAWHFTYESVCFKWGCNLLWGREFEHFGRLKFMRSCFSGQNVRRACGSVC